MTFNMTPVKVDMKSLPPSILIFGQPKIGKTTAMADLFPEYRWLCTRGAAALRYAAQKGRCPKDIISILQEDETGKSVNTYDSMTEFVAVWKAACQQGKAVSPGIVVDEFSTVLDRAMTDIQVRFPKGGYANIALIKEFSRMIYTLPRSTNRGLIMISHSQSAKYDDEVTSPTKGQIITRGGPSVPVQTMMGSLIAEVDAALEITLQNGKRMVRMEQDDKLVGGMAGYSGPAFIPVEELRRALVDSGYYFGG